MDYAVNVVFGTPRQRHPLISTLVSMALMGLVEVLMIFSWLVSQSLGLLVTYAPQMWGIDLAANAARTFLLAYVIPFGLMFGAVTCLYRYVPKARPAWRDAAVGCFVLTLLWELAKHLFSHYLQHLAVYSRMYGSLLLVVLFLLWVYYSAGLLLFGAAIVHRMHVRR